MRSEGTSSDYVIYGLKIRSSRPLVPLQLVPFPGQPDLCVTFSDDAATNPASNVHWQPIDLPQKRARPRLTLFQGGSWTRLTMRLRMGTLDVFLSEDHKRLWVHAPMEIPFGDVTAVFLGGILGFVLQMRHVICLHASVVELDGKAVVVCAPKGSGKSTLAAALVRDGAGRLIADDVAAIQSVDGKLCAMHGYSALRLNEDSLRQFETAAAADFDLVYETGLSKRYLPMYHNVDGAAGAVERPATISLIILLEDDAPDQIAPSAAKDALVGLRRNGFALYGAFTNEARAHEFQIISQLCREANIVQMRRHQGLNRLTHQVEDIKSHLETV